MRIVAGEYGGRRLAQPKGRDVRPTSDKVRGAMFNVLRGFGGVEGAHVLDGFCGSGALGLEALSQGAAQATFVDVAKPSLALARENADSLGAAERCGFILKDVTALRSVRQSFDLVFLDPPYALGLIPKALAALLKADALMDGAVCVIEVEKGFDGVLPAAFHVLQEKAYGDTKVIFARYAGSAPE